MADPGLAACPAAWHWGDAAKPHTLELDVQLLRRAMAKLTRAHHAHTLQRPAQIHVRKCRRAAGRHAGENMLRACGSQELQHGISSFVQGMHSRA